MQYLYLLKKYVVANVKGIFPSLFTFNFILEVSYIVFNLQNEWILYNTALQIVILNSE